MESYLISQNLSASTDSTLLEYENYLPPENPYLADSFWPIFHQSTYAQASTILEGPVPGETFEVDVLNLNLGGPSPWLVFSETYADGNRVIWGGTATHVFKVIATEDSFELIDSYRIDRDFTSFHWNLMILEDNKVIVADRGKNVYYKFADADPNDWSSEIVLEDVFEIPDSIPGTAGHFSLSYDGWLIFVTDAGYIVALSTDFTEYRSLQLPQEDGETNFHNTYALDESGGIFIGTTDSMMRVDWRNTEFSLAWDIPYDFRGPGCENVSRSMTEEFAAVRNGDTCTGSGTTPTLMGLEGQDELVLVADGHIPNNLIAFWRDEIPEDWEGLPGYDRRVAAVTPLPYSTPEGEGFTAENSPTVWGYDVVIAQYNGFDPGPNPLPGVQKLSWNPDTRTLDVAWATDAVNFNNVPTYSAGADLVYGTGQKDGVFYFWGLDWDTGEIAVEVRLGEGDDYLDQGNQLVIDEDGNVFYSSATGIVRLQAEPSPVSGDGYLNFSQFAQFQQLDEQVNLAVPATEINGFQLSQLFDETFYLSNNSDVENAIAAGAFNSGFEHFIDFGINEGRDPSILFNEDFYLAANPDVASAVSNGGFASGLAHYLNFGAFEGRDPSSLFDESDYLLENPDVQLAIDAGGFTNGFDHYIEVGAAEGRLPNLILFNENFYIARNADVAQAVTNGSIKNGLEHYVLFGQREGRDPSSLFDESAYLAVNSDVVDAIADGAFSSGFEHYIKFGRAEGREAIAVV